MFSIDQSRANPCLATYTVNGQRMLLPGRGAFQAGTDHRLPQLETAVNPASTLRHFHGTSAQDNHHVHGVPGVPWGPIQQTPPLHAVYGYSSNNEYHKPLPQYFHATNNIGFAQYPGATSTRFYGLYQEPKPTQSYIGLIAIAILSVPDQKLVLSDIYQYILDHYPYFRARGPGWRNSIRHNLSLNDCFVKSGRSANGKGHFWAIHTANLEDFKKSDFRRRRAQRKVRKYIGMKKMYTEKLVKETAPTDVNDCSLKTINQVDDCALTNDDDNGDTDIIVHVDEDTPFDDVEVDIISTHSTTRSSKVEHHQSYQTMMVSNSLKVDKSNYETGNEVIPVQDKSVAKIITEHQTKRNGPFDMDTILSSHFPCSWKIAQSDSLPHHNEVLEVPKNSQESPVFSGASSPGPQKSPVFPVRQTLLGLQVAQQNTELPVQQDSLVRQQSPVFQLPQASMLPVPQESSVLPSPQTPVVAVTHQSPVFQNHRLTVASYS